MDDDSDDKEIRKVAILALRIGDLYLWELCRKALDGDQAHRKLIRAIIATIRG